MRLKKLTLLSTPGLLILLLMLATPVAADKSFNKCKSCHSIKEGGKNGTGPNLWNIMNRGTAQAEGYKYSKKFLAWSEENSMWTPELMDLWLTNSKKMVKGTKMAYREKKENKRAEVIEYLQSMGDVQ
jgi:cytochrome c|tara:strand:+ start:359 stop:742 length:384 start_codon:yes stop_codon:yes gene_type:complete